MYLCWYQGHAKPSVLLHLHPHLSVEGDTCLAACFSRWVSWAPSCSAMAGSFLFICIFSFIHSTPANKGSENPDLNKSPLPPSQCECFQIGGNDCSFSWIREGQGSTCLLRFFCSLSRGPCGMHQHICHAAGNHRCLGSSSFRSQLGFSVYFSVHQTSSHEARWGYIVKCVVTQLAALYSFLVTVCMHSMEEGKAHFQVVI